MEIKIVLSTKDGKSYQQVIQEDSAKELFGKKIGDSIKGDLIGLNGFELLITGGSDSSGFPMRKDVIGPLKKRILAVKGVGIRKKRHGQRQRKTVAGNTIHEKTAQVNFKVVKEGKTPLGAEKPAEKPAEEAKPEAKPEAKAESKAEDSKK